MTGCRQGADLGAGPGLCDRDGAAARAGLPSFWQAADAHGAAAVEDSRIPEQRRAVRPAAQEVCQTPPRILGRHTLRPQTFASHGMLLSARGKSKQMPENSQDTMACVLASKRMLTWMRCLID